MNDFKTKLFFDIDWTFERTPVNGLPMCNYPLKELPTISWIKKALTKIIFIGENLLLYVNSSFFEDNDRRRIQQINANSNSVLRAYDTLDADLPTDSRPDLFKQFESAVEDLSNYVIGLKSSTGVKKSLSAATRASADANANAWGLERYADIFQNENVPLIASFLRDDKTFAYWRVAGNNPLVIKKITALPSNFPLTNTQYKQVMGNSDSLTLAANENRLYLADYAFMGAMAARTGFYKQATGMGYSYAPMALFAIPKGEKYLMPVAIQCDQDPKTNRIFLRSTNRDYYWGWQMAKSVVQCADENWHEMYSHLGFTHLVSEVFAVANIKHFDKKHPLGKLLTTHFEGTIFINYGATIGLMRPGQFVDTLFAANLNTIIGDVAAKRLGFHFFDNMLPNNLKIRGVDNPDELPEYPYRDDGLLIWNAIKDWVQDYVDLYYPDDQSLGLDAQLTAWTQDILANGKINGFKEIDSISTLVDVLTMIIFTASAQHAAVNFAQYDFMRYAPSISATCKAAAPYSPVGKSNIDWNHMLQNYDQALLKYTIYSLLGGVYHGYLGQYTKNCKGDSVFNDDRITASNGILEKFRNNLKGIESQINLKNQSRPLVYDYLLPSKIPASTNI